MRALNTSLSSYLFFTSFRCLHFLVECWKDTVNSREHYLSCLICRFVGFKKWECKKFNLPLLTILFTKSISWLLDQTVLPISHVTWMKPFLYIGRVCHCIKTDVISILCALSIHQLKFLMLSISRLISPRSKEILSDAKAPLPDSSVLTESPHYLKAETGTSPRWVYKLCPT